MHSIAPKRLAGNLDRSSMPLYQQLKAHLLAQIQGGQYQPGDRLPAEPQLAERFGVSRMTANKAILELVSEGVLSRRKRYGTFVADPRAAINREFRPVVAVDESIIALEDEYFQGLFWALHDELAAHNVALQSVRVGAVERAEHYAGLNANPLITVGPPKTMLNGLLEHARTGARVLLLGAAWQGFGIVAIDSDNVLGSAIAVQHLVSLGHRRIAFVGAYPDDSNTIDRVRGFKGALASLGYPYDERLTIVSPKLLADDPTATAALEGLLVGRNACTGVFAAGSHIAMEVISICRNLGLRVPEDVSVIGYDDPPFAQRSFPALTTIRQPLEAMVRAAADLVMQPTWTEPSKGQYLVFDPVLVVRGTTAKPLQ